ncbi:hypothetical protein B0I35DRAFT_403620 [Stachybotrys elegans]|uniref:Transcription factor domain-containing protein n=1 Tax=Stachybotrys elegans TaxID=80388 RepID=A0A8K0WX80_9HYPO|nr:hypothetical protein B0I35DRAFT_403620 [Stachybotrys elegans]
MPSATKRVQFANAVEKATEGQGARPKESVVNSRHTSPMSSNEDEDEHAEPDSKLDPIPDAEEPEAAARRPVARKASRTTGMSFPSHQHSLGRRGSETPSQEGNKSSSPSASTVTTGSFTTAPLQMSEFPATPGGRPDFSHLPLQMQRHLNWFIDNITYHHYCLNLDGDNFFKDILPHVALTDEALLNALVGFSAYHTTLQDPDGKLEDFLQYYNRSVTLLLACLKRKERYSVGTLLTILQLATIEEYFGDWVNLMGHQKAALEVITTMFAPQTIAQTAIGRGCHYWYSRFDTFVGLLGGFPTDLPREYFTAIENFTQAQTAAQPESIRWKIEERAAHLRVITYDMSIIFARGSRGQLSANDFAYEHDQLTKRLEEWRSSWDPALTDPAYLVNDWPRKEPDADDIVNPYEPGLVYEAPLFNSTMMSVEWLSIMLMHKTQVSNVPIQTLFMELSQYAYKILQYFEALEFWPLTPKGVLLNIQSCLSLAALFVPQDKRHQMWLRRKFAIAETQGYIYPLSLRSKVAAHFGDPHCVRWWLPNDEGFSPTIQNIRNFADERNAAAVTVQQESLREVRHLFAKLELAGEGPGNK